MNQISAQSVKNILKWVSEEPMKIGPKGHTLCVRRGLILGSDEAGDLIDFQFEKNHPKAFEATFKWVNAVVYAQ